MGRLLTGLLLIAAFCLGASVSYFNWTTVTFHYLAGQVQMPLIGLLLGAFLVGLLVMWLLGLARVFVLSRDNRRLQRQIRDLEGELRSLRNLPLASSAPPAQAPPATPAKHA